MNVKRTLVTGGAGFVGHHLVKRLLDEGFEVYAIDNFSFGKKDHVAPFQSHPKFRMIEGDITDSALIRNIFDTFKPSVVFHLAALHFIPYCISHPAETVQVNALGTQRVLDALEGSSVERFIFASTADVYAFSDQPHRETDPLGSNNIYGLTKRWGEEMLQVAAGRYSGIRFTACRFFNIYGPGETNPHVLPDILGCLKRDRRLRLGNMHPKRDYIYVEDVVEALFRFATYEGTQSVFNLGTGVASSVRNVVDALQEILNTDLKIETDPSRVRKVDREHLVADISKITAELEWSPFFDLRRGLEKTMELEGIL